MKLHSILSNLEFQDIIAWLPHGRAWRILRHKAFEERVIPLYFRHGRYSSFARQVNGWGFKRITHGTDYNSYYHEKFLRGLPHLCEKMKRLTPKDICKTKDDDTLAPDFYAMSRDHPLPVDNSGIPAAGPPPLLMTSAVGSSTPSLPQGTGLLSTANPAVLAPPVVGPGMPSVAAVSSLLHPGALAASASIPGIGTLPTVSAAQSMTQFDASILQQLQALGPWLAGGVTAPVTAVLPQGSNVVAPATIPLMAPAPFAFNTAAPQALIQNPAPAFTQPAVAAPVAWNPQAFLTQWLQAQAAAQAASQSVTAVAAPHGLAALPATTTAQTTASHQITAPTHAYLYPTAAGAGAPAFTTVAMPAPVPLAAPGSAPLAPAALNPYLLAQLQRQLASGAMAAAPLPTNQPAPATATPGLNATVPAPSNPTPVPTVTNPAASPVAGVVGAPAPMPPPAPTHMVTNNLTGIPNLGTMDLSALIASNLAALTGLQQASGFNGPTAPL